MLGGLTRTQVPAHFERHSHGGARRAHGTQPPSTTQTSLTAVHAQQHAGAELNVVTREGDIVTLDWSRDVDVTYSKLRARADLDGDGRTDVRTQASSFERSVQTRFSLEVQGDLSAEERADLEELMSAVRDALRGLRTPAWRPARYGIAALVLTQLLGLNLWAWHLRSTLDAKREKQVALLQSTFPHVRAVLDAPLQMQREVALLRAAAGQPDASDLEPLLRAAAAAWPADLAAVESIRFEPGRLTLAASSWDAGRIEQFRAQLQPMGLRLDVADGRLVLSRAAAGGGRS